MPISIGIPFYNAEKYLADAIRSVFAQTYHDWELILVDDGSTDGSLEIARSVRDPRVRVLSDGKNSRLATRLNQIAQEARYDFVARMDADDLMSPARLEKQMEVLEREPETDLVTTGVVSMTNDFEVLGVRAHHSRRISWADLIQRNGCGVVHAAILGRREWFLRNPYDSGVRFGQDYDLWLRASSRDDFRIHLLEEPLYFYREEGNVTPEKWFIGCRHVQSAYWKYVGLRGLPQIFKYWLKSWVVRFLAATNAMGFLLKRRSRVVREGPILDQFRRDLASIRATSIPGIDDKAAG